MRSHPGIYLNTGQNEIKRLKSMGCCRYEAERSSDVAIQKMAKILDHDPSSGGSC